MDKARLITLYGAIRRSLSVKQRFIYGFVLVTLTFAVYANSLGNGFVWDDTDIIVGNSLLRDAQNLPRLLASEDAFPGLKTGYYRPVTYFTFFLDRSVWGLNPFGFHLTNVVLHVLVALSLYHLFLVLSGSPSFAFVSALIFSLHPVNTETVNFLSGGRNTLLSALFMLISFILYTGRNYIVSVVAFAFSIFSKEFGLLLPLLLIVYDRAVLAETRSWKSYAPFAAVILIYLAARSVVVGGAGIAFDAEQLPNRLMFVPELFMRYLKTLLLAVPRIPYVLALPESFTVGVGANAAGFAALVLALVSARKLRPVFFFAVWSFIFIIPVSNLVPLGPIVMADRYVYFSSMGFGFLLGYLIKHLRVTLKTALVLFICLFYGAVVVARNPAWRDNYSLYNQMTVDSPAAAMGYYNLGLQLYENNDLKKAADMLEEAVKRYPRNADHFTSLALVYLEVGDLDGSSDLLQKAVSLDPDNFRTYFILGRVLERKGDIQKAESYFNKARSLFPGFEPAVRKRAEMLCIKAERFQAENEPDMSERFYRKALLYDPHFVRAVIGLGSVVAEKGDIDGAIGYFKKASKLDPLHPVPHYNLSLAYGMKGMYKEAESETALFLKLGGRH